jgi:hypothetical protein
MTDNDQLQLIRKRTPLCSMARACTMLITAIGTMAQMKLTSGGLPGPTGRTLASPSRDCRFIAGRVTKDIDLQEALGRTKRKAAGLYSTDWTLLPRSNCAVKSLEQRITRSVNGSTTCLTS